MQNKTTRTSYPLRVLFVLLLLLGSWPGMSNADLLDKQSFRPIEWQSDFARDNALYVSAMSLYQGSHIVSLNGRSMDSAFGLQLSQKLRDNWRGRVGMFFGRTGSDVGEYLWSSLGSDLEHPLVPETSYQSTIFRHVRPTGFFGLGVTSRWKNVGLGLNLIPTLRYELSEPVIYAGLQLLVPVANELIVSADYRFLQSARVSVNRGGTLGMSLIWGKI